MSKHLLRVKARQEFNNKRCLELEERERKAKQLEEYTKLKNMNRLERAMSLDSKMKMERLKMDLVKAEQSISNLVVDTKDLDDELISDLEVRIKGLNSLVAILGDKYDSKEIEEYVDQSKKKLLDCKDRINKRKTLRIKYDELCKNISTLEGKVEMPLEKPELIRQNAITTIGEITILKPVEEPIIEMPIEQEIKPIEIEMKEIKLDPKVERPDNLEVINLSNYADNVNQTLEKIEDVISKMSESQEEKPKKKKNKVKSVTPKIEPKIPKVKPLPKWH